MVSVLSRRTSTGGGGRVLATTGLLQSSRILIALILAVAWSILFLTNLMSKQNATLLSLIVQPRDDDHNLPMLASSISQMNQHQSSALVPMSSIPANEHHVIPGVFKYGASDDDGGGMSANASSSSSSPELIITGASITGDYHHPQHVLWFQLLGMGENMFREGHNYGICENRTNNATTYNLKPWAEMINEEFFCRVDQREARLQLMPSSNYDANSVEAIQVWRCPLRGIQGQDDLISYSDMEHFFLPPNQARHDLALAVEVIHRGKGGITTQVVKITLPISKPSIGIHQILSDPPATGSFLNERHNITLCVVSHANGIPRLNEHIRYHHDIIGIDHIHLGLLTDFGKENKDKAKRVHHALNNFLFKSDVGEGALIVSPLWSEEFDIQCGGQEFKKLSFYQECLYRAKSTSEFVATWDLDEFFLFTSRDSRGKRSLPDFLRSIDQSKCQDWSYVTMRSSSAGGEVPDDHVTGLAMFDFPTRGNETNNVWLKSIARTEKCFLNSPHILGSCLPPGKLNISDTIAMHPEHGECAFLTDDAVMVHARTQRLGQGDVLVESGLVQSVLIDG